MNFIEFKNTLKEGKVLTIKFYDEEYNPKTDKYELDLNREIDFKLVNGQLLEVLTNCE